MKHGLFKLIVICLLGACAYYLKQANENQQSFDPEEFIDTAVDAGFDLAADATNDLALEERIIVTTTDVNANLARSIISRLILLDKRSHSEPIDLYLRTEGGWGDDAFAIVDIMQSLQSPVNVHALGGTHSSGCIILAAATGDRIVYPNSILGFHTPREDDDDDIYGDRYIGFWKKHTKLPQSWLDRRDDEMVYFNAEDAIRYEVADHIASGAHKVEN